MRPVSFTFLEINDNELVCCSFSASSKNVWRVDFVDGALSLQAAFDKLAFLSNSQGIGLNIDYCSFVPNEILSFRTHGIAEIRQGCVVPYEMDEVYNSAKNIGLPKGFDILQMDLLWYKVDQHFKVTDPLGLSGKRLEGYFHLLAIEKTKINYLKELAKKSKINIKNFILTPSLLLCRDDLDYLDEQVLVIDLRKKQCLIALGSNGISSFIAKHEMGISLLDKDLSSCLNISLEDARKIRVEYPYWHSQLGIKRYNNGLDLNFISEILFSRSFEMAETIFELVKEHIRWDVSLNVVIYSNNIEHYWSRCLGHFFSNAKIIFKNLDQDAIDSDIIAVGRYINIWERNNKAISLEGWRYWWKKIWNWIEYHL